MVQTHPCPSKEGKSQLRRALTERGDYNMTGEETAATVVLA